MSVHEFIRRHYRHFNAASLKDAAEAYRVHIDGGGKMMVTLAGAMSTAELGLSLAEMIRRDMVHAITCTGANLEEDLFNLVAHDHYVRIPEWRNLAPQQEKDLESRGLNRVTDTCIPEEKAFRALERHILAAWKKADAAGERRLPHEFFYELVRSGVLEDSFQTDPEHSWLVAAARRDLPLFVPGWEDSTMGNIFAANVLRGEISRPDVVGSGIEYMLALADWYEETTMGAPVRAMLTAGGGASRPPGHGAAIPPEEARTTVGFFQIGGGIAGDFPICVVPMLHQDLELPCPYWGYFCQISDSTTSYGSYSGAIPTEKITWGKLDLPTPKFVIESDATIVAPLVFAYLLGW
ncbi:MAG: deoxyhypusine synthase family protein [Gemmatimonadota bacterium]|nr:deoxyhypusine synthase family protein [Gemmatimonadota bacterium]